MVSITSLDKSYHDTQVLFDINLEIYNGEFLTLLGPSGCGKTTLLRILGGFEDIDTGEILLEGKSIAHIPPHKRSTNTVFQSYALFPHMSVFDNVAFGLKMKGISKSQIHDKVTQMLRIVKLEDFAKKTPKELSGGQQQRVAIARAVVNKPALLLLDESLSALDYKLRKAMQIELKELQRQLGITFVFVTHDQEEALSMSDRIVVMNHGKIEQIGTPKEVYENPKNLFVADFIGQINKLKATVLSQSQSHLDLEILATQITLKKPKQKDYANELTVVVRPEDFRVERRLEDVPSKFHIQGTLHQMIYKGVTIDLIIEVGESKTLHVSEFYNEDSDALTYKEGETLYLYWLEGWEVLLES
jgi:spermidine/putrescine transport system ATP-binding protein